MTDDDTIRDVNNAHPDHEESITQLYRRGPDVIAPDGGRRRADDRRDPDGGDAPDGPDDPVNPGDQPEGTMEDVSHTPVEGVGADRVWDGTQVRERNRDDRDDDE